MKYLYALGLCCFAAFMLNAQPPLTQKGSSLDILYNQSEAQRDVSIINTNTINSEDVEFSPVIYHNGLVFVSRFKSGPVDEKTGETYFELFYAQLDPNGVPGKPQPFSVELNSQRHEGPVSFNRKGDRIFFTRTNQTNGVTKADRRSKVHLKIYEADRGYYDWENVRELPFNSDRFSCMHPALSADENRLFFSSDMPGGYGGMDIYFSEKTPKGWSKPINLGPDINSAGNEVFPFQHNSGALFFSSDGHKGIGGLDLYMIDMGTRKWSRVINLGAPFNTISDDLGLILNERGTRGYFTSNRDGGSGKDDIYMFDIPSGIKGIQLPQAVSTILTAYDGADSKRAMGVNVYVFEKAQEGLVDNEALYNLELVSGADQKDEMAFKLVRKSEEQLGAPRQITNRNGEAVMQFEPKKSYLILVSKPGFTTQEITYTTPDEPPFRPIEVVLTPSNCITLDGQVFSEKYNLRVPNALVKIVNECDGKMETTRTNINGAFQACLTMGCDFNVTVEKDGYLAGYADISTVKIRGSRSSQVELKLKPKNDAVLREPIRTGTVIVLENILYDFDKSAIRTGEARDLEALSRLMKQYASMEIELGAHTDTRGPADYNLQLSIKRAESAKEFLVLRGINSNRIKAIGYGETKPRNHCGEDVECTEEEHKVNRRTEVKITKIDESAVVGYSPNGLQVKDE